MLERKNTEPPKTGRGKIQNQENIESV